MFTKVWQMTFTANLPAEFDHHLLTTLAMPHAKIWSVLWPLNQKVF